MKRATPCLNCGKKPAKCLPAVLKETCCDEPFFCSLRCAAVYGYNQAINIETFCPVHREWHNSDDGCAKCDEE